jgi:predicted dehydrogenase
MKSILNRRSFLRRTAALAGAMSAGYLLPRSKLLAASGVANRLRCVQIGCGERAMTHLNWLINQSRDHLTAIVDPDEKRHAEVIKWLKKQNHDPGNLKIFTDYRVMFDQLGRHIDAVFIATPNHHHATAATLALQHGKAVFCEKPLCHDIAEARKLRELARHAKVPAQMGNQGHCQEGYRRLCEFIWAGVVGKITETHSWTDRANGGIGPRPPSLPVPRGLHWDTWIGPAPYRDYHSDLHPHEWHGWYDFGNGSLGNMGCHVLDGVFWALKLEHPTAIEVEEMRDGSDERFPTGSRIRWDFPARGDLPAVKVYWYEGLKPGADIGAVGQLQSAREGSRNLPPLLVELQKQYPDEEFDSNGTFYVGEKGILYTATYGGRMHLLPRAKMEEISQPPKSLPRPKNIMDDFLDACREGKTKTAAGFDYAARLTEFTLLGNLAQRAGAGRKVEWDGAGMKVTNLPELNAWVKRPHRKGWPA